MTDHDLSKHSKWKNSDERKSDNTLPVITSKDRDLPVWKAQKKKYDLDLSKPILVELTDSGLSDWKESEDGKSDNKVPMITSNDHDLPVLTARKKQYGLSNWKDIKRDIILPPMMTLKDRDRPVLTARKKQYGVDLSKHILEELTDSGLSDWKESEDEKSDNTLPVITSKNRYRPVLTARKKNYGVDLRKHILKEMTDSDLSKHSVWKECDDRESSETSQSITSRDRKLSVRKARKKQYGLGLKNPIPKEMTDSDLSKHSDWKKCDDRESSETSQSITSRDRKLSMRKARKKQYGLDLKKPIPKEMTDSDLSKQSVWKECDERGSSETSQSITSRDRKLSVRKTRKKQYGLDLKKPIPKEMTDSDLSKQSVWKECDERESSETSQSITSRDRKLSVRKARKKQYGLDLKKPIPMPHSDLSKQSDLKDTDERESDNTFHPGVHPSVYCTELGNYLEEYYNESAHFNKYLFHGLENIGNCSFALVPNLMIFGKQASKEATCSIKEALSECPQTILLLARETALPGIYLVLIWLQRLSMCQGSFCVLSPYNQIDNMECMYQFKGVFLLEVAEGDDVSDLKKMMSQRFKMKDRYYLNKILIIFECNHEDPVKLKALFNTVNASELNQCTFLIITSADKTVVEALKLNADKTLISDGIESLQISFLARELSTINVGKVISRHINQIVSKRKNNLWEKGTIEKVRLEFSDTFNIRNNFIRLPAGVRSIDMHSCEPTIHLVHTANTLDVSCSRSLLDGTFDPISILSSTLTTVSLCFSAESHIFREKMYERFANGLSQTPKITSLLLRNMKVGRKVLTVNFEKNEIEQMKESVKTNEDYRRYGARILGPTLQKETFDKKDINADLGLADSDEYSPDLPLFWKPSDSFAAYIMLDLICYELVKTNDDVTECYPAMRNQCEIVIVCFLNKHIDMASFKGFPLVKRDNSFVSKESLRAENSLNREESTFITKANKEFVAINETVSYHADNLMESHRNLEAVKVSYAKSTRGQYEHPHPCIVFYCKAKGYIPYGEDSFPKKLNHPFQDKTYDTDVREGFFTSCPYLISRSTDWNKELALGCSIGEINTNVAATLGPFVNIKETGDTCFLTVRHLFTPLPPARNESQIVGVKVVQPSDIHLPPTIRAIPDGICGEVLSSDIGGQIDAALVKICPARLPTRGHLVNITKDDLNFAGLSLTELPTYDDGAYMDAKTLTVKDFATRRIIKIGNTTSLTKGSLSTTDGVVRETMEYTTLETLYNGSRQKYVVKSQLLVDSYVKKIFCQAGDSGSAVFLVDDDNRLHCIGMVIGMLVNDCTAVITPIKNILDILGHKLGKTLELKRFEFDQMDEN